MRRLGHLLRLLQFADSALPVGSFSFSNGLEAAIQHRVVTDAGTLRQFVITATRQAATSDAVAMLVAHRAARRDDIGAVVEADRAVLARKLSEEARTMTARMGRKLGELADRVAPAPLLSEWLRRVRQGDTPGAFPVGLAIVCEAQGLAEDELFAAHQYGVATVMLGAALRLMRISFLDTQAILAEINATAEEAFPRAAALGLQDMSGFAPLADILAAAHVSARVRMFMS